MPTFKDVEIIKAANIYFDGGVTSRVIKFKVGSTKNTWSNDARVI